MSNATECRLVSVAPAASPCRAQPQVPERRPLERAEANCRHRWAALCAAPSGSTKKGSTQETMA